MGRSNNFDAVRVVAALVVIVGHAFVLTGEAAPRLLGLPLHSFGVSVFFCVSGYLIAGSLERASSVGRFLWHRALRIFPALIVLTALTIAVLGPASTSLPVAGYFSSAVTWAYGLNVLLLAQYDLPGVFDSAVHARTAVNGSLWTLGVEFCCYLGVFAAWFVRRRLRPALYLVAFAVLIALSGAGGAIGSSAELCAFFASAAALRLLVPRRWLRWPAAVVAVTLLIVAAGTGAQQLALWVALPLLVIAVGTGSVSGIRRAARWGDISYGLYLWGYPVQQLVIDRFGILPMPANLAVVVPVTVVLAAASWWLVERSALRFKDVRTPVPAV